MYIASTNMYNIRIKRQQCDISGLCHYVTIFYYLQLVNIVSTQKRNKISEKMTDKGM